MVEVIVTHDFESWYEDLTAEEQEDIRVVVGLLEERGVGLGYPYSSAIGATQLPLRELRIQHQGRPYRIFYAFDPKRQAVLLIGGDKTGRDRFYEEMVPKAERIWREYLTESSA